VSNQDFPRTHRLLTSRDFSGVFNNAKIKIHLPHFLVLATDNTISHTRLGCVVAKKHAKRANQRNRIKRIIRETFRLNQDKLSAIDVVVMVKPGIAKQDNKHLLEELDLLWQKPTLVKSV
jgi:ribonuclease P protein component